VDHGSNDDFILFHSVDYAVTVSKYFTEILVIDLWQHSSRAREVGQRDVRIFLTTVLA
jgi:hypothetical protein